MLIKDYDIEEVTNQNDIEECLRDISKKWRDETIHRLHFHFSGNGIMDQTFVKAFNTNQDFMESTIQSLCWIFKACTLPLSWHTIIAIPLVWEELFKRG